MLRNRYLGLVASMSAFAPCLVHAQDAVSTADVPDQARSQHAAATKLSNTLKPVDHGSW